MFENVDISFAFSGKETHLDAESIFAGEFLNKAGPCANHLVRAIVAVSPGGEIDSLTKHTF